MFLTVRDAVVPIQASEVPSWVSGSLLEMKIDVFLATLLVYDAGEGAFGVVVFFSPLIVISKS